MSGFGRLDVIVLALMFACVVCVVAHISFRYRLVRRVRDIDARRRRQLVSDLSVEVGILKSIASAAPYLGLAGTCVGILSAFGGFAMERHTYMALMATKIGAATVTTAVGILVAAPANFCYNYLRTRIDVLESGAGSEAIEQRSRYFRDGRRFALPKRFSQLPTFGLIAAPVLAFLVAAYTPFFFLHYPTGFGIDLASADCEYDGNDRLILHVTNAGKLFLNTKQEEWDGVADRLSEIYSARAKRSLYLLADDGVSVQTVAEAIDMVRNTPIAGGSDLHITVRLITQRGISSHCSNGSSEHVSR